MLRLVRILSERRKKKVKRERFSERERGKGLYFSFFSFIYMLKSKLKIRPSSGDSSSRACDCLENSTRSLEKLFIRCYPLKTLHQIPHISN